MLNLRLNFNSVSYTTFVLVITLAESICDTADAVKSAIDGLNPSKMVDSLLKAKGLFYFHVKQKGTETVAADCGAPGADRRADHAGRPVARAQERGELHSRGGARNHHDAAVQGPDGALVSRLPGLPAVAVARAHLRQSYMPMFLHVHGNIISNPLEMQHAE